MRRALARVMSSPRKAIRPAAGASTPEMAFKVVVFAGAVGADQVTSSPCLTSIERSRTASTLP